jgi:hypothetical protein
LDIKTKEQRKYVCIELSRKVTQKILEKVSTPRANYYKTIDNTLIEIPWYNITTNNIIPLRFPCSHQDGSEFPFEKHLVVSSGDLVVFSGVSNMGKTALAQNLLFENMDKFPCRMMVNEYNPGKFFRRISKMNWATPMKADNTPKFSLVERHDDWQYAIEPDWINIIDWIDLGDREFWKIGTVMGDIQRKLNKGIAVICIQKNESKELGIGGQFSEHLASLYFNIDYQRLTVRKVKEYTGGYNPNNKVYGFDLEEGVHFNNIREVKLCTKCAGRIVAFKMNCDACKGKGYVEINHSEGIA